MTNEPLTELVATGEAPYVQFGAPGVPFSAIRVPLPSDPAEAAAWIDRALKVAAYLQRKFAETFPEPVQAPQNRPQQAQRPSGANRPAQGQNRPRGGSGGLTVLYTEDGPCCSMHKTSEGTPRPMRDFGDNYKCTAKKRDGTYCTLEISKADMDESPF